MDGKFALIESSPGFDPRILTLNPTYNLNLNDVVFDSESNGRNLSL